MLDGNGVRWAGARLRRACCDTGKRAAAHEIYCDSSKQIVSSVREKSEMLPCSVCSNEINVQGSVLMFRTAVSMIRPADTTFTPRVGEISLNGAPEKENVSVAILPSTVRKILQPRHLIQERLASREVSECHGVSRSACHKRVTNLRVYEFALEVYLNRKPTLCGEDRVYKRKVKIGENGRSALALLGPNANMRVTAAVSQKRVRVAMICLLNC